jgi:ubiquinone/menaquinone biosynthesis C-methylase UbiE
MQRTVIPELLDTDAGSPAEVEGSLADLRLVNRWFGGASTLFRLVRNVAQRTGAREFSLLDVAGASGDIAHYVQARMLRLGVRVDIVLLDRSTSHLSQQFPAVAADALAMPFPDGSFDLVTSSLFLHHLEPEQIRSFANEALRVARVAVLANDLRRSALHLAAVYSGYVLYRSRLTRHDAPASVRRSYTAEELRDILRASSAARLEIEDSYLFRLAATLWKQEPR